MELNFTFLTISTAVIKIFVLAGIGYFLCRAKVIDGKFTDTLSLLLVRIIFPALIISKIIAHFSFAEESNWWLMPIWAIAFSLTGMLMGYLVYPAFRQFDSKKEFISSCAFQNCGYLPMTLILFAFKGAVADTLLIYLFFFITGFNIIVWSIVPLVLSGEIKKGMNSKVFLNPPILATIFSMIWVAVFGRGSMPAVLMDPVTRLGQAAFPIAMITLGSYLCMNRAHRPEKIAPLVACVGIKLFIFPAIVLAVLFVLPLSGIMKFFLFLQSIMPTAVSLVVIGSYTGADNRFFSSAIFYTHLIAIVSIPLWLAVFKAVCG